MEILRNEGVATNNFLIQDLGAEIYLKAFHDKSEPIKIKKDELDIHKILHADPIDFFPKMSIYRKEGAKSSPRDLWSPFFQEIDEKKLVVNYLVKLGLTILPKNDHPGYLQSKT